MIEFLSKISDLQITMLIIWVVVIAAGIIIEAQTSDLVSIWFAIAGSVALVCALADLSIYIQVIVFAALALVLVLATRPFVKKMTNNTEVKTNADRLVGMVGTITETIEPDAKGSVKVDFQEWTAVSKNNNLIEKGEKVVIKKITGNKLIVDKVEEIEIK